MNTDEWRELENLEGFESKLEKKRYNELLTKTQKEDEHPEWYDGPCLCVMCCTYQ
jgi:hypothetical protein